MSTIISLSHETVPRIFFLSLSLFLGQRSAESIVEAFRRRALAINPIINAVVDECFEAALREARKVDQRLDACTQEEREEIGRTQPLLGVPFTAKENVMVKGECVAWQVSDAMNPVKHSTKVWQDASHLL